MNHLSRHLRSLLIAIVALTMTAGLAAASRPTSDRQPNGISQGNPSESAEPDESEAPDGSESPDASESPDSSAGDNGGANCATDPTGLTADQLAAMSHGSIVCWAAHQDTPDGWDNHGAWVSHWAQLNRDGAAKSKGHGHQP